MHEHIDEFKLINMNGRVYDAVLGRFMQPDNQVQDPGFLQTFNKYAYVFNNPLSFTDPSGWVGGSGNYGNTDGVQVSNSVYASMYYGTGTSIIYGQNYYNTGNYTDPVYQTGPAGGNSTSTSGITAAVMSGMDNAPAVATRSAAKNTGRGGGGESYSISFPKNNEDIKVKSNSVVGISIVTASKVVSSELAIGVLARASIITLPLVLTGDTPKGKHELSDNTYYHYTNADNLAGILTTRALFPNKKNKVYITPFQLAPLAVTYKIFLNERTHTGKESFFIAFKISKFDEQMLQLDPSQPFELFYNGRLRIKQIVGYGPNIFKTH